MDMAFDGGVRGADKTNFLDLQFSGADIETALDAVTAHASLDLPFAYVTAADIDQAAAAARDPAGRALYDAAWILLNESSVLRKLAARVGFQLPVAGAGNLAARLLATVIDPEEPVTIIGASAESVERLERVYGLLDVRWRQTPQGLLQDPGAIVRAAAFAAGQGARFTFICTGAPVQEMIAYAIAQHAGASGAGICLDGGLESVFAAARKRSKLRFVSPARLWRRYFVDGPKASSLFAAWRASMAA
ncbi:MAG: hypothetical protein R3C25_05645 [Hyphomonadaceae bacterium]